MALKIPQEGGGGYFECNTKRSGTWFGKKYRRVNKLRASVKGHYLGRTGGLYKNFTEAYEATSAISRSTYLDARALAVERYVECVRGGGTTSLKKTLNERSAYCSDFEQSRWINMLEWKFTQRVGRGNMSEVTKRSQIHHYQSTLISSIREKRVFRVKLEYPNRERLQICDIKPRQNKLNGILVPIKLSLHIL